MNKLTIRQVLQLLNEAEAGTPAVQTCRKYGIGEVDEGSGERGGDRHCQVSRAAPSPRSSATAAFMKRRCPATAVAASGSSFVTIASSSWLAK